MSRSARSILRFEEIVSTSSYLKANHQGVAQYGVVSARFQTAGRGQRGNGWESERGKNILMSMLFYPPESLLPACQFIISKAVSLAVVDLVEDCLQGTDAPEVAIKWPNDIYIGDRKVAGILIEHSLSRADRIDHTVIGIGLNINQQRFVSGAPNPVSLIEFVQHELDVDLMLERLAVSLERRLEQLTDTDFADSYRNRLWRRCGYHRYMALAPSSAPAPTALTAESVLSQTIDVALSVADASQQTSTPPMPQVADGTPSRISPGAIFEGEIVDVLPDGPLLMRLRDGSLHQFNFKELTPVI